MAERYLVSQIKEDLQNKMVFLAGPRQVGKTTLAKHLLEELGNGDYLLWDNRSDCKQILSAKWPAEKLDCSG